MSGLSLGSPGSSPQLGSPGHLPPSYHQSQATHFGFNSATMTVVGALTGLPSGGSPGAPLPPPPSPSHQPPTQPPPPLPPRSHRRRDSSVSESPQQVSVSTLCLGISFLNSVFFLVSGSTGSKRSHTSTERRNVTASLASEEGRASRYVTASTFGYFESKQFGTTGEAKFYAGSNRSGADSSQTSYVFQWSESHKTRPDSTKRYIICESQQFLRDSTAKVFFFF